MSRKQQAKAVMPALTTTDVATPCTGMTAGQLIAKLSEYPADTPLTMSGKATGMVCCVQEEKIWKDFTRRYADGRKRHIVRRAASLNIHDDDEGYGFT